MNAYQQVMIKTKEEFFSIKSQWEELTDSLDVDVTLTWAWLYSWWEIFAEKNQLFILTYYLDGQLKVIAPFYIKQIPGILSESKTLHFLGTGETERDEICTEYLDIIGDNEHIDHIATIIADTIGQARSDIDSVFFVDHLSSSNIEKISDHLKKLYFHQVLTRNSVCPYVNLPKTWEELLVQSKINSREQINRKFRLLEKEGSTEFEIVDLTKNPNVLFERFAPLHQARWESEGEPGCFSSSRFCEFHKKLLCNQKEDVTANAYFLKLNGRDIAARYCFIYKNRAYDYSVGLMPNVASKSSPGMLIIGKIIEHCIDNNIQYFDFFKGSKSGYKYKWTDIERIVHRTKFIRMGLPLIKYQLKNKVFELLKTIRNFFRKD